MCLARYRMSASTNSGTLPKLYAKLRRAERRAQQSGNWKAVVRHRRALHHVEEAVRHFVEREFLAVLHDSRSWGGRSVAAGTIDMGSNRVRIELRGHDPAAPSLWIAFDEQSGWLVAGVAEAGWLGQLSGDPRRALRAALAGLYKRAGVDLVHEHLAALFGPRPFTYAASAEQLRVWREDGGAAE